MKKLLLSLIAVFTFTAILTGQNENHFAYKNALKISPVEFANSTFQLTLERYIKDRKSSILLIPSVILKDGTIEAKKGVEIMLQYRFFLTHLKKGESKTLGMYNIGFFTGPYVNGLIYHEDFQRSYGGNTPPFEYVTAMFEKEVKSVEGGAIIGVQFDITSRILFDLYVGGGIRYSDVVNTFDPFREEEYYYDEKNIFDKDYTGVKPTLGFQLGFAF